MQTVPGSLVSTFGHSRGNPGYFTALAQSHAQPSNLKEFKRNWNALREAKNSPRQLVEIFESTISFIDGLPDEQKYYAHRFLAKNLHIWEKAFQMQMQNASAIALAQAIGCYLRIRLLPNQEFLAALQTQSAHLLDGPVSKDDVRFSGKTMFRLAMLLETINQDFLDGFKKNIDQANASAVASALCASAVLSVSTGDERFHEFADSMPAIPESQLEKMISRSRHRFQMAYAWFDKPCNINVEPETDDRSETEKRLLHFLKKASGKCGIKVSAAEKIQSFGHRPDITLYNERRAYIEVDGPYHYIYEYDPENDAFAVSRMDGHTVLRNGLEARDVHMPVVLNVPFVAADNMISAQFSAKRLDFAQSFITEILKQYPGNYFLISHAKGHHKIVSTKGGEIPSIKGISLDFMQPLPA